MIFCDLARSFFESSCEISYSYLENMTKIGNCSDGKVYYSFCGGGSVQSCKGAYAPLIGLSSCDELCDPSTEIECTDGSYSLPLKDDGNEWIFFGFGFIATILVFAYLFYKKSR